jgi:hypothetical protein
MSTSKECPNCGEGVFRILEFRDEGTNEAIVLYRCMKCYEDSKYEELGDSDLEQETSRDDMIDYD